MSNCRSGCPTKDHANWGECLKASNIQMNAGDASSGMIKSGWTNKKWDAELQAFRDAKAQGIQPKSTKMKDIRAAVEISNKTGVAFKG